MLQALFFAFLGHRAKGNYLRIFSETRFIVVLSMATKLHIENFRICQVPHLFKNCVTCYKFKQKIKIPEVTTAKRDT